VCVSKLFCSSKHPSALLSLFWSCLWLWWWGESHFLFRVTIAIHISACPPPVNLTAHPYAALTSFASTFLHPKRNGCTGSRYTTHPTQLIQFTRMCAPILQL
jgi:hypothetical protein